MNINNLIGQKNIGISKQPSSEKGMMYGCSVGASSHEAQGMPYPVVASEDAEPCVMAGNDKSEGKEVYVLDYKIRNNNKDSECFVRIQLIAIEPNGGKHLYVANNGSYEIKEFFKLVEDGTVSLPLKTKICMEGNSCYFEQFHTSNQEACDLLCQELGI